MSHAPAAPSEAEIQLLSELLIEYAGIGIATHRRDAVLRFVAMRIAALRLGDLTAYYRYLRFAPAASAELNEIVRFVTVNETYFFREAYQFETLFGAEGLILPSTARGPVRVLSAGCSSGEEAYSLIIHAQEAGHGTGPGAVSVDAFDIHPDRVSTARRGVYRRGSLRTLDAEQISRYFEVLDDDQFEIRDRYRGGASFATGNLLDLASYPSSGLYDAVFCRNVLIYFSERSLRMVIANFRTLLRPGGFLFLGHSESIIGLSDEICPIRVGRHIIYQRAGRERATASFGRAS